MRRDSAPARAKAIGFSTLTFVIGVLAGLLLAGSILLSSSENSGDWPPLSFLIAGGALAFGFAMIRLTAYWRTSLVWPLIGAATGFLIPWMLLIYTFCGDGQCAGE